MISVRNLKFSYRRSDVETLHGLNFEISEKEIFGFLGPSGAGKSTTQKILIGLLKDFQGDVDVMGRPIREWGSDYFESVGVSFELPNHYLKLSAKENLDYFRSLYSGPTCQPGEVLKWVGLDQDANKLVAEFSKGMKIRLNVARALIHRPKILFLDEPTSGLDPSNARKMKDLILEVRDRGTTVFVTTHDMMVADELCDRVAFINHGTIDVIDSPTVLKRQYGKRTVRVEFLEHASKNLPPNLQVKEFPLDELGQNQEFGELLISAKRVETIHSQETTLEKIFIQITGQELSV